VSVTLWPEPHHRVGYWPEATTARRPTLAAPKQWRRWLDALFPSYVRAEPAPRHADFWDAVWAIEPDSDPDPFVGIWPRGGAKSTSVELGATSLGLRGKRRYGIYIRDTQERADDSVQNIGAMLESSAVERYYPEHAERRVTKFGQSKGWRRNRLRTAGGFTIDALGLDVAGRGAKLEEQRPDLLIFDDIDGRHDSPHVTEKKLTTIKESLLPAGTANVAVFLIQNLIIPRGVVARLADGSADFLARRRMSGPEPAVFGLKTENRLNEALGRVMPVITEGRASWKGQDLAACQRLLDKIGLRSFERECQHNVKDREGALWTSAQIDATRTTKRAERYKRIVVGIDPSGGGTEIGIVAGGLRYDGHVDILADRTQKGAAGPRNWAKVSLDLLEDLFGDTLLAEVNFGGDMVKANIHAVNPRAIVKVVHASRGKDVRAEPVSTRYSEGLVHHVGHFPEMEAEMTGWVPGDPESPNRLDANVWVVTELLPTFPDRDFAPDRWQRAYA
jgi:hypothetical protein